MKSLVEGNILLKDTERLGRAGTMGAFKKPRPGPDGPVPSFFVGSGTYFELQVDHYEGQQVVAGEK